MIFVGRDDCELMLQSRSVDKQHAVINYDLNTDEHMVKDLGSLNGTFVNDLRIPDQTYITLKLSDVIRFGYDAHVYILEKSQHKVPEEALKHEKYTSQLQLSIKSLEAKSKEKQQQLQSSEKSKDAVSSLKQQDRAERRAQSLTAPTDSPISKPTPLYGQPSWWGEDEDPANTKQNREPAKDVSHSPSDIQSHASFTIEFDECTPGKMKIKDHVTKFALRQAHKQAATEAATAPTEVMTAESKVADWLVQSNASMLRRMSQGENLYNASSHSSGVKITAENYSENGTRSDSVHPAINGDDFVQSEAQDVAWVSSRTSPDSEELLSHSPPESQSLSSHSKSELQQTPFSSVGRKSKLSREFTAELLKQKQNSSSSWEKNASSSPKAALKRAEMVFQSNKTSASPPPSERHHQPQTISPVDQPIPLKTSTTSTLSVDVKGPRNEDEDNLSDAGTYTIEVDAQDKELEEARRKIDQVQQAAALVPGAPKWMSCWASLADSYTDSGPSSGLFDIPSQMELSGGVRGAIVFPKTALGQHLDSSDADASKARRILPQDDVEPDSLSDASKSDDGSIIEHSKGQLSDAEDKPRLAVKATAFYIGSEEESKPQHGALKTTTPKAERKLVNRTFSTATLTKLKGIQACETVKSTASEPILGQRTQSPEDTSSTVSQHSNNTKTNTLMKKTAVDVLQRDMFSNKIASQDSNHQPEKPHSCGLSRTEPVRRTVGLRHSVGRTGSVDLSDEPQSLPYSDQESSSNQTHRKYTVPLQKEDGKTPRIAQVLSRTSSLSAPRPTRASMLRKARLGDSSDNEGTETDKLSQEASNAPTKNPQETKKLSRLDMLAMPRRRTSSFNTPSDTESSSTPQWTSRNAGFSNRNADVSSSSNPRTSTAPPTKPTERPLKAALSKPPVTRSRSGSTKYASSTASSRRRQKGSDYTSTSDEEYDSNWTNLKHKRSQPSSASHSPRGQPRPQPVVARHPKPRSSRESDEENREGEAFHSWTAHSAEIARLSQDLAKDLAILAREIHDVAGDGDPQTPTGVHSAPTAHEQQVPLIPESGSNQVQPKKEPEQNSRKLAHNRDEVKVGSSMLSPVYEVTADIRESAQQLADKIKMLFQDRVDVWEDIESKMNSDVHTVSKSSNKEITSILKELRGIKIQLDVINAVMEPSDTPEGPKTSSPASSSSSDVRSSRTPPPRDWRTIHSVFKRGGGPRPSESVRRAAVTPDDLREGYLV
uniref:FHA domain-containing protein n=1 Tax=Iconisemion striatum TaxID=60296 RepID=A0A1A7X0Y8_9TELE